MLLSGAEKTLSIISERLKWKQSLPDADVLELPFQILENILQQMALVMSAEPFVRELLRWIMISWVYHLWPSTWFICASIFTIYKPFCGDFRGQMAVHTKGRWCLCEQMSVFLRAGRRSSLSVCINELAVMFDHHAYHSHFQNSISKARQSCPWEVSFAVF